MEREHENVTVAKLSSAVVLVTANMGQKWDGSLGEAVEAAAKYLKESFEK